MSISRKILRPIAILMFFIVVLCNPLSISFFARDGLLSIQSKFIILLFDILLCTFALLFWRVQKIQISLKNAIILFFILLLFFIMSELSLRILHVQEPVFYRTDKELGWKNIPNLQIDYFNPITGKVTYQSFRNGFCRYPEERKERTIWVIGDSFTQAAQVSKGEAYYDVIAEKFPDVNVFAYGTGAYSSLQEFLILEKYIDEIKPDIVVWQFCSNDFSDNLHELDSLSLPNAMMVRPYLNNNNIEYLFSDYFPQYLHYSHTFKHFRLIYMYHFKVKRFHNFLEENPLLLKKSLTVTAKIFNKIRQKFPQQKICLFTTQYQKITGGEDYLHDLTKQNKIHFISNIPYLLKEAKNSGKKIDFSPVDNHWNQQGHRIVGEAIADYLNTLME